MMKKRSYLLAIVLGVLLISNVRISASELSETPAGKLIENYLATLNAGDESKMRAFLEANVSPAALKDRPVEPRLGVMKDLKARHGTLTFDKIQSVAEDAITVLVKNTHGDWFEFTLFHDGADPAKMLGLGIEDYEPPLESNLEPLTQEQLLSELESLLDKKAESGEFSGAVLIARHGNPIFRKAYGMADLGNSVPNRPDTKFNLGSINKTFTRRAIEMLAAQGKLSLTDPIGKFLTDYPNPEAAAKVTIKHLLEMQGGIGDFFGEKFENTPKDKFRRLQDFVPMFSDQKLHFEPGTKSEYSNGGYILLGVIIEKVSNRDYFDFVRENIFEPAGMANTDWYEADAIVSNLAMGYTSESSLDGSLRSNIYSRPAKGSAAGGGYSTIDDLLKYTLAGESGKFGPAQSMSIAGGAPGINAAVEPGLRGGFTVIVLSNYDPRTAERTAREIRGLVSRIIE